MITEASGKQELLTAIDQPVSELLQLMSSLSDDDVNTIPYEGSWTPAQLLRHVSKSTAAIAGAMKRKSEPVERNPGERIEQLRKTFLDFTRKLNAPDFIIPEEGPYEKQASINELRQSFQSLKEGVDHANLDELVKGLPMGEVTKLELLHFVLYHTQRHLHQMKKIVGALMNSKS